DLPRVRMQAEATVETVPLDGRSDAELEELSRRNTWALSLAEMRAIREHYAKPEVREKRASAGLGDPTDVEIEVLAQTWSEHCKHKIFAARIRYEDKSGDEAS